MLQSIWQDVQQQFRHGNMVTQIILVNIAVFIVVNILRLVGRGIPGATFDDTVVNFFSLSSDWVHNLTHPWSILTYGFLHAGLGHIFWNMLLFYWFGRIVGDLIGNQRILPLYLWGVLLGGLVYWLSATILPYGTGTSYIVGASAGVMAVIVAAAFIAPEYIFRLILIGEVRLKYIALAIILIDIFAFGTDNNTGGHFAHMGGMLMGYLFVSQLRNGQDLAVPVNRVGDRITGFFRSFGESPKKRRTAARVVSTGRSASRSSASAKTSASAPAGPSAADRQAQLDAILEKIKAKGMGSLSKEERDFLSLESRNNN